MGIRFYNLNGFFVKKLAHGVNVVFVDGHTKMMGYHDIPGDTKTGIGEQKKDPNYFWAQWKK